MMWKVLLVEDEPFVRRKLRKLVSWEELGYTVSGEASNGLEALRLMEQHKPDLVIADIMMPGMDGLELLRTAREAGLEGKFIMLTCMNEFEYARRALEYGASGYILKLSMNIAELQGVLVKINKELSSDSEQKALLLHRTFHQYYGQVWNALQTGGREEHPAVPLPGPASCEVQSRDSASISPPARSVKFKWVFMATVYAGTKPLAPSDLLQQGAVEEQAGMWSDSFTADGLTTLFFWSEQKPGIQSDRLAALPAKGVYSLPFPPRHLPGRWRRQLRQLNALWFESRLGLEEAKLEERAGKGAFGREWAGSWKAEKEAIAAFEQFRRDDLAAALAVYWQAMREQDACAEAVREVAGRLDRIFTSIAGEASGSIEPLVPEAAFSHEELLERLAHRAEQLLAAMAQTQSRLTDHSGINRILQYLHQHYNGNITLRAMARMVAMEEHYLSRLFRQKTGESLINYLQMLRVEKAKLLLKETGLAISEIGRSVGFPNENYFVRTFKKWSGQTPGQHRKDERG